MTIGKYTVKNYDGLPGVNFSILKHINTSPKMFVHSLSARHRPSAAMSLGSAIHAVVLEPNGFQDAFSVYTDGIRRGKAWDAFKSGQEGKTILSGTEIEHVMKIANSVTGDPLACSFLTDIKPEMTFQWVDPFTGIECKGRVDGISADGSTIVGLKTTRATTMRQFSNEIVNFLYHAQWAYYHDAYVETYGKTPTMVEIVVCTQEPHDVVCYEVPGNVLMKGHALYQGWLAMLKTCRATGHWPGLSDGKLVPVELPLWAFDADDDDDDAGEVVIEGESF